MERLSLDVLNKALDVMKIIRDCCGGFDDSLEECKYEFLKQHKHFLELKEKGRLLELPCVVGTMTYKPDKYTHRVEEHLVEKIEIDSNGVWIFNTSHGVIYPR